MFFIAVGSRHCFSQYICLRKILFRYEKVVKETHFLNFVPTTFINTLKKQGGSVGLLLPFHELIRRYIKASHHVGRCEFDGRPREPELSESLASFYSTKLVM